MSVNLPINLAACTGCGLCASDCLRGILTVREGKAAVKPGICMECGHCVAICPSNAIRLPGSDESAIRPYDAATFAIEPDRLLNFMAFRRSVRKFRPDRVEPEKVQRLLDAGRYAPTGANRQKTRYILLQDQKKELTEIALHTLSETAKVMEQIPSMSGLLRYKEKWMNLYRLWQDSGVDKLFYDADCVLLVVTTDPAGGSGQLDAGLASANIELMANALGLGVCYIGFFSMAVGLNEELRSRLGLKENEELISTLAIGYPNVRYYRTVDRRPANLTRL